VLRLFTKYVIVDRAVDAYATIAKEKHGYNMEQVSRAVTRTTLTLLY